MQVMIMQLGMQMQSMLGSSLLGKPYWLVQLDTIVGMALYPVPLEHLAHILHNEWSQSQQNDDYMAGVEVNCLATETQARPGMFAAAGQHLLTHDAAGNLLQSNKSCA